ncbi:MAG: energy-coupling factor ABC transporter permease [Betaproteobacteria bacterium]|nr:energy-coupling factor ABC transporter permease [Betaproteobacteria bacterium]
MNLTDALIPPGWQWLWLVVGVIATRALWQAPWRVLTRPELHHVMLGACVLVLAFWQIHAGIRPGLSLHLLGATLLVLLFGPRFALLCLLLVLALDDAWFGSGWQAFAANALILAVVPVWVSWTVYRLADARLPNNLFIYIFVNGFFGAALSVLATGFVATGLLVAMGDYAWGDLSQTYLPYYYLMAWSEAVTTGMLVTVLVVYRPQWVATFDDKMYINGK